MTRTSWNPGTALGPYVLIAPAGSGGMGEVWKARDTRVERVVAIKRLRDEHVRRFRRESQAIAALNHPHICQLYDLGPDYLVMEYIDGVPLKGPVPVGEALRLARQIADALTAAHRRGIIHRDLKPANILVDENGAKLVDFGLATIAAPPSPDGETATGPLTELGAVVGTVAYMSPEQAQGRTLDGRSDVFSFGAVLYELLSGSRAFPGDTPAATLMAVVIGPTPLLDPSPLEPIVRQCLAKDAGQRFQSMSDVRAALEQAARAIVDASNEHLPPSFVTGARIGPYELLECLGAGPLGEIWRGRDTRLGRPVAVKRLTGVRYRIAFEQEARAIAVLSHPNICQLYDMGPDYLIMEYIEGQPMRVPLALGEAVRLATQVAAALEEAHSKGIVACALTPASIMINKDGSVKLVDFGVSRLVEPDPRSRTVDALSSSSVAYMSPEQIKGQTLDARADVFSFGALMYAMLAGTRAFQGSTTAAVCDSVLWSEPAPLDVPGVVNLIVRRCLAKDPDERFHTMTDVHHALDRAAREILPQGQASIAVLPFTSMSSSPEDKLFGDGLAEELTNVLARVPNLKVAARTSAFAFRTGEQDIRTIAASLGVLTILEGSVRRSGNRIRVTAQLINAANGYHLWSERYDREFTEVFAIQDEIVQAIAAALAGLSAS
jgi:serine/threonine protein kinase